MVYFAALELQRPLPSRHDLRQIHFQDLLERVERVDELPLLDDQAVTHLEEAGILNLDDAAVGLLHVQAQDDGDVVTLRYTAPSPRGHLTLGEVTGRIVG